MCYFMRLIVDTTASLCNKYGMEFGEYERSGEMHATLMNI